MRGHDSQFQAIQSTMSNFMFDSLKGTCTLTNLVSGSGGSLGAKSLKSGHRKQVSEWTRLLRRLETKTEEPRLITLGMYVEDWKPRTKRSLAP